LEDDRRRPSIHPFAIRFVALLVSTFPLHTLRADVLLFPSGDHGVRIIVLSAGDEIRPNPALVAPDWSRPTLRLNSGERGSGVKVGGMVVSVTPSPLTVRVEDGSGRLVQELEFEEAGKAVSFLLGDGPVLGLGEGAKQFDRRGAVYPIRNGQVEGLATLGGRIHVPFVIGTSGWALFFGSPYGEFDLRGQRGIFKPSTPGAIDLFVIDARQPAEAMREFMRLTGAPVMPPKWALGYMQSHRTLTDDAAILEEARTFRKKQLPCDTFIFLGTGFCPAGWNTGHDSFRFNRKVFSRDPAEVIDDLHKAHLHVALHVVPPKLDTPLHGDIPAAPGQSLDDQHIASYWKRHHDVFALGVDGWWPDEGDWYTVPERLERHKMYYQGPLSERPNVRPWNLQRNGYAGIARYGGWVWSGDVSSTWRTLAAHVRVGQNYSLSVSPFWGTDTGGFIPTRELTGEFYTRWFQFSAFCPSFRSHGRTWHLRLPWGWNTGEPGPIETRLQPAEAELHNAQVEPICRDYLNLRYQLMPYTYTTTRETRDTGLPMMRALWLHYPNDAEAVRRGDEYLWGRDLLVAPVVERGATHREVYLPPGDWYDWWTSEKLSGRRTLSRPVDLKTMPIYVRAGAIIPLDPVRQYVDEPVNEPMIVRVYRGADGRFVLYEDDGVSLDYLQGAGRWTAFAWSDAERKLGISLDDRTREKPDAVRHFDVLLLPDNQRKKVEFSGTPVEVRF
jgi:alpha-glucosidase (family GH31 glycosyl hydrolase)